MTTSTPNLTVGSWAFSPTHGESLRILDVETPKQEVLASDNNRIEVDSFLRYRINDTLRFFQAVRTEEIAANQFVSVSVVKQRLRLASVSPKLLDVYAADGMTPHATLAVHLAEHVMQQNIGSAGCIRTGKIADDGVKTECGLDRRRFKPRIKQITGAFGEQIQYVAARCHVELFEAARGLERGKKITDTAADIGRRFQCQIAQHVGEAVVAA